MDDVFIDIYGGVLGVTAISVYCALCRHADKNQQCFPSKQTIATKLGASERAVYTAIKALESVGIIEVTKLKAKNGQFASLSYKLTDRSQWQLLPTATIADGKKKHSPTAKNDSHQRQPLPYKELTTKLLTTNDCVASATPPLDTSVQAKENSETAIQSLVRCWKKILNIPRADWQSWDYVNFPRHAKWASELIVVFGDDLEQIVSCMQDVYVELSEKNLSCTLKTVANKSHEWRMKNGTVENSAN